MKLLLIDGNSVLFRAFYATSYGNMMKTSTGIYTNAVYSFANMLNKALNEIKPDYLAVAFDKGKHTFRHELNPDYKGGRKETPEELVPQFALVREMLDSFHIKYLEYDDIEADDIIGTLAKKFKIDTCILSSDHDLMQLIDDTTHMYVMKKGMSEIDRLDEKGLMNEYSLKPYQIIDFKGLSGDKSDNIKGVEGIGEKTATKLLNEYDTCEGIYEHIDEIKGKLQEKLIRDKDSCFLSKKLATIKTDVDIDLSLDDLRINIDEDGKNDFFNKYEMYSLARRNPKKKETSSVSSKKVSKISKEMYENPFIYFDSDEFSYFENRIYGICFAIKDRCEYISFEDFKNDEEAISFLGSDKPKIVYGLKAILHSLSYNGLSIGENTDDVLLMSFLVNNYHNDMASILNSYGLSRTYELKDIYGTIKKPHEIDEIKQMSNAYEISSYCRSIFDDALSKLKDNDSYSLYKDVELPLSRVLYEMEKEGVYCDIEELDKIASQTLDKMTVLEKGIYKDAGHEFNISSPKQLANVLFNELDLPNLKKDSTSADILEKLKDYHPIIRNILDYRKYSKLYSTYAEGLKKYICKDNKIHTIFSQTITQTGRLSSYEPNLQNISVRDDEGREIRKAFKPGEDSVLISSDYSQIELRVLASLADEEKMIDAFNNDIDIHTKTAMDVFKVSKEDVTPIIRRQAKAVNFGVVYGISDFGLANQTSLSFKDAKKFIDDYFNAYPNIKTYLDNQVEFCKENGYVKTILNRRRYINEIHDRNYMTREFGKRAAMNSTIQGSAADIIKIAMVNISRKIKEENLKSKLILQVHDELIFNVPNSEVETMKKLILEGMSSAYKLKVRLDSSLAIGETWYEAK